jgi:hypothetical protein
MDKVLMTPTHIYSATRPAPKGGNKSRAEDTRYSETIYVGGSTYTKVGGKWIRGSWTTQQVMKQEEENRQNSKYSCRYLRDESVNGEAAAVYGTHSQNEDITSDGQVWISKKTGLPLRHEFDIDAGGPIKNISTKSITRCAMNTRMSIRQWDAEPVLCCHRRRYGTPNVPSFAG